MQEKILIISSGILPVPATKGGAVENLTEHFINENETQKEFKLHVLSINDNQAQEKAKEYQNTLFTFIKSNKLIKLLDNLIYKFFVKIIHKSNAMTYKHALQRLYFIYKCSKHIHQNHYDKIIIQNSTSLFLALKWFKNYQKYQDRYYFHIHNNIKRDYGCKKIIRDCNQIICVSDYIKRNVATYLELDYSSSKLVVIKNCININDFNGKCSTTKKKHLLNKYQIPNNKKIIIFTGRLTKEKGIEELLKAISKIKNNDFILLIVGSYFFDSNISNNFIKSIESLILKLKDKVIFTGYIDYKELPKIYAIADFAVLPSIWEEPAGLTMIEALSSNLPLITTISGGIPEYVKSDATIFIPLDKNIVENLVHNITWLLEDKEKLATMKSLARKTVIKYNPQNYFTELKNILKK